MECDAPAPIVASIDTYRATRESVQGPPLQALALHSVARGCQVDLGGQLPQHGPRGIVLSTGSLTFLRHHLCPLTLPLTTPEGGYIRMSLEGVAGTGGIASIELRKSPLAVGHGWFGAIAKLAPCIFMPAGVIQGDAQGAVLSRLGAFQRAPCLAAAPPCRVTA